MDESDCSSDLATAQPGAGAQLERLITDAEPASVLGPKFLLPRGLERSDVRARWTDAARYRQPDIIEIAVLRSGRRFAHPDVRQTRRGKQLAKVVLGAVAHAHGLVELRRSGIDRDSRVPETPQERHPVGVVPGCSRYPAAAPRCPSHLADAGNGIVHEVDDQ